MHVVSCGLFEFCLWVVGGGNAAAKLCSVGVQRSVVCVCACATYRVCVRGTAAEELRWRGD